MFDFLRGNSPQNLEAMKAMQMQQALQGTQMNQNPMARAEMARQFEQYRPEMGGAMPQMEKSPLEKFNSVMKAGTGGIMSQPMPAAPQGLLRAAAPQQAPMTPQMPQAPQMSPYMQTLQNMIMGRYG
jgi:hypothetical protein